LSTAQSLTVTDIARQTRNWSDTRKKRALSVIAGQDTRKVVYGIQIMNRESKASSLGYLQYIKSLLFTRHRTMGISSISKAFFLPVIAPWVSLDQSSSEETTSGIGDGVRDPGVSMTGSSTRRSSSACTAALRTRRRRAGTLTSACRGGR
jgi:hypothetical protein